MMRWSSSQKLLLLIILSSCCFIFIYWLLQNQLLRSAVPEDEECFCLDNSTNSDYDMCYRLPSNRSVRGIRFSCELVPIAVRLKILGQSFLTVEQEYQNFKFPPIFVTASSSNHFAEAMRLAGNIQQLMPTQRLIFYDLGLTESEGSLVKSYCNVIYRRFPFEIYPGRVRYLGEYRWKPLIIAETLAEFGAIWYMDSSVVFSTSELMPIYDLLACHRNSTLVNVGLWSPKNREHNCTQFPYMLYDPTGHSVFATTAAGLYRYFPNVDLSQATSTEMFGAGFALVVQTNVVVREILKWYVLCALEDDCMAPVGAQLACQFGLDRWKYSAGCHRFDQSVINLLLANLLNHDTRRYTSGFQDFYKIVRGTGNEKFTPHSC